MLAYVPNSIIMKKGPEYLKKKVRFVTDDVREDGLYKAMKKNGDYLMDEEYSKVTMVESVSYRGIQPEKL